MFNDGNNQIPGQNEPGLDASGIMWYKDGIWCDSETDTDGDELPDCGELRYGSGAKVYVFTTQDGDNKRPATYGEVQGNNDFDGDGLKNGDEVSVLVEKPYNRPYLWVKSFPDSEDSDGDLVEDKIDPKPLYFQNTVVYDYEARERAILYATRWYNGYNEPKYVRYIDADCANFVSQCLHEAGIPMSGQGRTDGWHSYNLGQKSYLEYFESFSTYFKGIIFKSGRYNYDVSESWSMAKSNYDFFSTENYSLNTYEFFSKNEVLNAVKNGEITKGDLMYFEWNDETHHELSHATIISLAISNFLSDGPLLGYAAHTEARLHADLDTFFDGETAYSVHVIHLRDRMIVD